MSHRPTQQCFYVYPDKLIWTNVRQRRSGFHGKRLNQLIDANSGYKRLMFSERSRRELRKIISWFAAQATDKTTYCKVQKKSFKFKLNFVTLTLSSKQVHSDQVIKEQLLNQFLVELRSKYKVTKYLWRAESQGNGNIHFHITTDKYIYWKHLRDNWNRIQNKLGYIDKFEAKFGHRDANSTDVHSVVKIKNIAAYLSKYLTKSDKYRIIEGKQFGCSQILSSIKSLYIEEGSKEYAELQEAVTTHNVIRHDADYCSLIFANWDGSFRRYKSTISQTYKDFIEAIRSDALHLIERFDHSKHLELLKIKYCS